MVGDGFLVRCCLCQAGCQCADFRNVGAGRLRAPPTFINKPTLQCGNPLLVPWPSP